MQLHLRCQSCALRMSAELNEFQQRELDREGFLSRFCRACAANTRWQPVQGNESFAPAPSGMQGRILLIDDDPDILTVLGKALARENFDLDTASSARDAIMRLARDDYDLILSDIRMPEFDGTQLFSFLDERMPEYKDRVIFLTGDTGTPATNEFLRRTQAPHLIKPIDLEKLRGMIRKALEAGAAG